MLLGITSFEIRYQLRNPVFWVSVAVFFLLGFGITASENVSIGTPGGVHENAPSAIAIATSILTLFYLFVVTAFVANAIVRDDSSGFAPIVRATSVTAHQIVLGRFFGGLIVAWLGYLAVPLGMWVGSIMPWVDPETIGPQKLAYYAWSFWVFAVPDVLLLCAVLFALATILRSMMAAYIGAVLLVMGYLVASSTIGQKIEYRDTFARWEPLGNAALGEAMRYWTQAELNSRLVDLGGTILFNRVFCVLLAVGFLAVTLWRFTMTERAPSKRKLRRLAKRQKKEAALAAVTPATGGERVNIRDAQPSIASQFMTRLRVEMRMVLTSPGLIVLTLFAVANTAGFLWFATSLYGTVDHPTLSAVITGVSGNFQIILLIIAGFYGGELVWRERDRKFNELIDSTPVASWVMTVPKILAIFLVLLVVNLAAMATGLFYQLVQGSHFVGIPEYVLWFIIPAALNGLLIEQLETLPEAGAEVSIGEYQFEVLQRPPDTRAESNPFAAGGWKQFSCGS